MPFVGKCWQKERTATKMTIGTLNKMLGLAVLYTELYNDYDNGFISSSRGLDRKPELHLTAEAFDELARKLEPVIEFKNNEKLTPCFIFMGVRIFCVLTEEEAAERGYLTEAEAAFYGK